MQIRKYIDNLTEKQRQKINDVLIVVIIYACIALFIAIALHL